MTYSLKISHEINGWISIHAADAWRGNTTGYLAIRGMYTSFVTVCSAVYSKTVCLNNSKFAHIMTHPLLKTFQLTQLFTLIQSGTVSHYHSLAHLHIQCHLLIQSPSPTNSHVHSLTIDCLVNILPLAHSTHHWSLNVSVSQSHITWSYCHPHSRKTELRWCFHVSQWK